MGHGLKTSEPSAALLEFINDSVSQSKALAWAGAGNLFRMVLDNNSAASDVFVQLYDAASTGAVTVGVGIIQSYRVPANGQLILDPNDFPIHWFALGCVVAACSTRSGSSAPAANPSVKLWFQNNR